MNKHNSRKSASAESRGEESKAGLDKDIQLRIGDGLRAMYDDVVKEGVPDRFAELLKALDQQGGDEKDSPEK
jgi:hypothetical protein